jgi:diguanylate cyclase
VTERRERESERRERIEWAARIDAALSEQRMLVLGQPIFELATFAQFSTELLVRMRDTEGTELQPAAFLPAAARLGLIQAIDVWMVQRALESATATRQVNLSAVSLL